jgi:hypothetical protein
MQGRRRNVGRVSVNLSGAQATRLTAGGQPQPRVVRPQAATPDVPRSGSRQLPAGDATGAVTQPLPRTQVSASDPVYPGQKVQR